jgi:hypothetical protein
MFVTYSASYCPSGKFLDVWKVYVYVGYICMYVCLCRDEVTGEWRRLHNEELNDLYSSPNIVRVIKSGRMRWAGHVARMGKRRGAYRILVGRHEGKRPLATPRRRWEDNIKMDLQEVGWGAWTGLIWLRIGTGGGLL